MTALISARGLTKRYATTKAIDGLSFEIEAGRIVGLIGPNGAGKTTMLSAIAGLSTVEGELKVLGLDPHTKRKAMMELVSYVADTAILPRWIRVGELVNFMEGVHPKFQRQKALDSIAKTKLKPTMKVGEMSKGMVVQLHLALVMAIDAKLLILDEPTLGLDIINRQQFYRSLLEDYFDGERTIIISTHQIEEVEHVVSDLMFIKEGKLVLHETMDDVAGRFTELMPDLEHLADAAAFNPINSKILLGRTSMIFDGIERSKLAQFGDVKVPALSDIFMATIMKGDK